jgi:LPS export ABC transporter permease LptF
MKLLDRYIGREVLVTTLFAVGVLSLVLVLGNIFKKLFDLLVNQSVPLDLILSFIGYILPFSLTFTIPWGFLTAVLLVFGKLSAENELTALRSSGVSITRICAPVLVLALVATALCFWINVEVAPRAQRQMKEALLNIITNDPLALFSSDKVIDEFPAHKIYVGEKSGASLRNLLVYQLNEDSEPIRVVAAKRGELRTEVEEQRVLLKLFDARMEQRNDADPDNLSKIQQGTMAEGVLPISLKELYEKNKRRGAGLSQLTLSELQRERGGRKPSALATEVNKRYSFSLASLAFALIGVPLAVTAHRRETSIGFAFSLGIAFVYFFFIIIADTLRENSAAHPELLVWVPNVLFMALGAVLFYRLQRR